MKAHAGTIGRLLLPLLATWAAGACSSDSPDSAPPARDTVRIESPNFVQQPSFFGYISATTLSVRDAPGTNANAVGYVFKGDRVDIFESRDVGGSTWHRMTDAAGYVDGWISGRFVSGRPIGGTAPPPSGYGPRQTPTVVTNVSARYVGTAACRRCHSDPGPGQIPGGEYGVWSNHYHASAYQTLSRPYTRALAQQKRGIQDPAADWRCLKCHVTALGVASERLGPGYRDEDGVTCEVCHGPGGDYLLSHWEGQDGFETRAAAGFTTYTNIEERDRLCRSCHNALSPTYKPFNVASFSAAIRHWTDEHQFVEVASDAEVATEAPQPIAQAPPPAIDTLEAPPPVTNLLVDTDPAVSPTSATGPGAPRVGRTPPAAVLQPEPQMPTPAAEPAPAAEPTPPAATGRDEGPAEMVLDEQGNRGRVGFPHHDHFEMVTPSAGGETCQVCHHTSDVGDTPDACSDCHLVEATLDAPSAEKAYHGTCKNCHREQQAGPKKCSQCHIR